MAAVRAIRGQNKPSSTLRAAEEMRMMTLVGAGDVHAFEELYYLYAPRLWSFLSSLLRRPEMIEEVLDDTMMVVWSRPGSFHGASKLSTWIFGIAYRRALNALRRRDDPVLDLTRDLRADEDADPALELSRLKSEQALARALAQLSQDHRAVVQLTYFHNMGVREIAEIMGCPINTVKTRMYNAKRHLRRILKGDLADWI